MIIPVYMFTKKDLEGVLALVWEFHDASVSTNLFVYNWSWEIRSEKYGNLDRAELMEIGGKRMLENEEIKNFG